MKVILFIGAGASVELGVPAMRKMVEQFRNHLRDIALPTDVIDKINRLIDNTNNDMEHAIDLVDKMENGFRAREAFGEEIDEASVAPYRMIRQEAERFVQHCCEQVKADSAIRMWSPTLRSIENSEITIASTNYDRAVEIAAARLRFKIDDGFEEFSGRETAKWTGVNSNSTTVLLKLHGSTDWYRDESDSVLKIRHPMPLFGTLRVAPERDANALQSALVLPSREKVTTLMPFPSLAAEFRHRAQRADVAVFLGSSLRDPHMRDVCLGCAPRIPTFVVSRSGRYQVGVVPTQATTIAQTCGRFLTSTLPEVLRKQSLDTLHEIASRTQSTDEADTLRWLVSALDGANSRMDRCTAIEQLAEARISIQEAELAELLNDQDEDVATYALGLIPICARPDISLQEAKNISGRVSNANYQKELQLLEQILSHS